MAKVRFDHVTKLFGVKTALDDINLEIADGQFFVLLGPTGAGKTTTLRLIAGLERAQSGKVWIGDHDVSDWGAAERDVALVLQQYSLYPRYTVRENLEFPLKPKSRGLTEAEIDDRVATAAKIVRIEHLLNRKTDRLSGGEMQRVSIGRAIVRRPRIFLMDEPLSNLDAKLRESLRAELKDLQTKLGATFLFVTHDQIEAMSMADKIGVLEAGRLVQIGTPNEIYTVPANIFVAGFVGSPTMNLMNGAVREDGAVKVADELVVSLRPSGIAPGSRLTLGVRAENVRIGSSEPYSGRVHDIENHGVEKIITIRQADLTLRATANAKIFLRIDEPVRFGWEVGHIHVFGADGKRLPHN
jgi:multiple sugar transport system ATP-binding protein